jgi:hypothetical protein
MSFVGSSERVVGHHFLGDSNGTSGQTSLRLQAPTDIIQDVFGNLLVADENNYRVQFFLRGQANGTTVAGMTGVAGYTGTYLNSSASVVVDTHWNLYVCDHYNMRVQKLTRL